jgi:hypothetical protein
MRDDFGTLITIATHFAALSLFAVGGLQSRAPRLFIGPQLRRWCR